MDFNRIQENFFNILRRFRDMRVRLRGAWAKNANTRSFKVLAATLIPVAVLYVFFLGPPIGFPSGEIVTIEQGATLTDVAQQFKEQKIIRSPFVLKVLVTLGNGDENVVAGDYQFSSPASVFTVARNITIGAFGLVPERIRIPEGASVEDMAILFERRLDKFNPEKFIELAKPHEGYLFPDTYFFLPNANEDVVVQTMLSNFEINIAEIQDEIDAYGLPLEDIVTMASILELEASIYADRQKIAGVLWRRIDINMPLQVDAAFLYFLGRTTFDLTLADLQTDSPYNTYRYKGLPPGPITNPGLAAIRAAVNPIDTGALFYLADFSGVTHYSKTYEEHLSKKRFYYGY